MTHRVTNVEHFVPYGDHDARMFYIDFAHRGHSHTMLCGFRDDIGVQVSHSDDAPDVMNKELMETMARDIVEHRYLFEQ